MENEWKVNLLNALVEEVGRDYIRREEDLNIQGRFDACIKCNNKILACIEFKSSKFAHINDLLRHCLSIQVYNLIVIKNFNDIQLIELSPSGYKIKSITWSDLIEFCKNLINSFKRAPKGIAEYVANWINNKCKNVVDFTVTKDDLNLSTTEIMLSEAKEQEFFKALLGKGWIRRVCRFSNLDSARICVDDKKQNMLSIVCMNDKSECYYADNFIDPSSKVIEWYNSISSTIETTIESYILSLSREDMKDNLTMWRLYGNDAKGVSLIYECPENMPDGFYLAPVDYANSKKSHKKLTLIKKLTEGVYGHHITFRHWNVWKHFFKPKEYMVEKEIRLVFLDNQEMAIHPEKKWIISKNNNILSPMIVFPFIPNPGEYGFPLALKEITLGSKCPEKDVNKATLQYLADVRFGKDANGTSNIKVGISDISSYRD